MSGLPVPLVDAVDLSFAYDLDRFRLQLPSLVIEESETVAIVGPSGCGKTTLLHLITGILQPQSGQLQVLGSAVSAMTDDQARDFRLQNIGMVFQSFELLDYLNVLDNILLPVRIGRAVSLSGAIRKRAGLLAEQMGIGDKLSRPIGRLSQGERQRVAVARALLLRPPLLLADEPTGNLDPANKDKVLSLLLDYAEQEKSGLITVTHDSTLLDRFSRVLDFSTLNQAEVAA
ncbi:MAG: ATP-binding cassette domain-containing protein [Pseudomonadales bacterium]